VEASGQIVIGGTFFDINGSARDGIARLSSTGALDGGFNPSVGGLVTTLAIQANGQILVAGGNGLVRLNSGGTIDGSFGANPGNVVNSIAIQPDGRIVVGGDFNNLGSPPRNYIARLNTNGTLDAAFAVPGANATVKSVAVQPDGKILLAGDFTSVNGTNRQRIARLNSSGEVDTTFDPGAGADQIVNSLFLPSDGNILLGGAFTSVNTAARAFAARLLGAAALRPFLAGLGFTNGQFRFSLAGLASQTIVIQASTNLQSWLPISTNTLTNSPVILSDPQSSTNRSRFYRGVVVP
jgi:uncharacterized delta-60 repeat protein